MPDERELAREILSGKVTVEGLSRHQPSAPPAKLPTDAGKAIPAGTTGPVTPPPVVAAGSIPEIKAPTVTNSPDPGRKFPCKQCGARLDFDPSQRALKCPYCGHVEEIAPDKTGVQEHDFQDAHSKINMSTGTIAGRSTEVRCTGCGAMVLAEDNVETLSCPFCATHLENAPRTTAAAMICPESLLPFKIAQREAVTAFNNWISSRWFAPGNLKQLANLGQLSGVYLPFWTYDSMTYSHYTGQRGDDYWETEFYTDSEGRAQTRQVRRTRWTYVSGEVDHFFDDVLVCASRSVPEKDVTHLEPWDLKDLEGFKSEFLAGFKTERYVVSLGDGFKEAKGIIDSEIRTLIARDIGGDHQQISAVNSQYVGITFKHILLPMWLAVYRYQDQTYRILVNARNSEVTGSRPYSWIKIGLVIFAGIVAAVIVGLIVAHAQ